MPFQTLSRLQIGIIFLLLTLLFHGLIFGYVAALDRERQYTETDYVMPVVPSDSSDYALLAENMLEHGVFSTSKTEPFIAEIHWPPGYPLFLAATKYVSGGFVLAALVQVALIALVAYLMFLIGERFVLRGLALLPPLLLIFDPSIAFYAVTIHSDVLFTALIMIIVYGLFFSRWRGFVGTSPLVFGLWGILLGFATLVRPIGEFLLIGLPVLAIIYFWDRTQLRRYVGYVTLFVAGFLLVITPWLVRNHGAAGSYMLADVGSKNLLLYNVKYFLTEREVAKRGELSSLEAGGYANVPQGDVVMAELTDALQKRIAERGGQVHDHYISVALGYILDDPLGYTKFHLVNTAPYFLAGSVRHFLVSAVGPFKERAGLPYPKHTNIANHISTLLAHGTVAEMYAAAKALSFVLIEVAYRMLLIVSGLLALLVKEWRVRSTVLLFWVLVLYFAILTGPVAFTRYRIVSEPYLLLTALVGVYALSGYVRTGWHYTRSRVRGLYTT